LIGIVKHEKEGVLKEFNKTSENLARYKQAYKKLVMRLLFVFIHCYIRNVNVKHFKKKNYNQEI